MKQYVSRAQDLWNKILELQEGASDSEIWEEIPMYRPVNTPGSLVASEE
jgi:hypothetical protein